MKRFIAVIFGLGLMLSARAGFAQQTAGTAYGTFSAAFAVPALSGVGTATLTYTTGNLSRGGVTKAITAGTLTSLDASASSCDGPAFSAPEFIYWASGTGLSKSTTYATAYNAGANIIVACITTDGSSNVLAIYPWSLNLPVAPNLIPGTSGGVPYFSAANALSTSAALTANSPMLGGGAGTTPATVAGITSDGISILTLGVAGTSVGSVALKNATSGTVTLAPTTGALGTVTATFPAASITLNGAVYTSCGTSATCSPTTQSSTVKIAYGSTALSSASPSTASVTISPAFTSSATYWCTASPEGTTATIAAAGIAINKTSGSAFTLTGPNTVTTVVDWACYGT